MLEHPYLAAAVARLPLIDATGRSWCDTLATDGYAIYVNTQFTSPLRDVHLMFVIAHELVHCVLGHMDRREQRDHFLWNIAADYATNMLLTEHGFHPLKGALIDVKYRDWSAEQVYEDLCEQASVAPKAHELAMARWGCLPVTMSRKKPRSMYGLDNHLDPNGAEAADCRPDPFPTPAERRRLRRELIEEAAAGDVAGRWRSELAPATVNPMAWQAALANFVSGLRRSDYRLFPPNRRHIHRGIYLPSLGVPGPQHLAVAVDTSGSMSTRLLAQVFSQIDHLRAATECQLTLIQFDVVVSSVVQIEPWEPTETLDLIGGQAIGRGGTDLRAPFHHIASSRDGQFAMLDALIVITDGYGAVPAELPPFPLLWVITPDGRNMCPFGATLTLPKQG